MRVHVLGCSGAIAKDCYTSAFLVEEGLLFDAGTGLGQLSLEQMLAIETVFLTHAHLDHIAALPLMLDSVIAERARKALPPVTVYALPDTIAALKKHIFNGFIWPDFTRLPSAERPVLRFEPIAVGQVITPGWRDVSVEVLPAHHTVEACGYAVSQSGKGAWVYTGDTGPNPAFWQRLNQLKVAALVIETAFSNQEAGIAEKALHHSPASLARELDHIDRYAQYPIYITHTKPAETAQIMREIDAFDAPAQEPDSGDVRHDIRWLQSGQILQVGSAALP